VAFLSFYFSLKNYLSRLVLPSSYLLPFFFPSLIFPHVATADPPTSHPCVWGWGGGFVFWTSISAYSYQQLLNFINLLQVPARNLHQHIQNLLQTDPGDNITPMELEFKNLANVKAEPSRYSLSVAREP
jgi:hypothetical protein